MDCELARAEKRLLIAEELLLRPTPDAIRETKMILEEAFSLVQQFTKSEAIASTSESELRQKIERFEMLCRRVTRLLEGALKVQWMRIHWIAAITETYTRSAKKKSWRPASRTLNLEM